MKGVNLRGMSALSVLLAGAGGVPAHSQARTEVPAPAAQAAADADTGIADIVVTARRTEESSQRVPIAITTVTEQKLLDLSARDILEVRKISPGVFIASEGNSGRAIIAIRGQSQADFKLLTDSSVGVYVDGINYARSYGLRTSLVDTARVEVLKGPQGTLFGKNTTGGAINITTQHPVYRLEGYVDALYGSYDNRQLLGVLNVPLVDDKLAVRVVGQRTKRDGYGRDGNGDYLGDDNLAYGRVLVQANPTSAIDVLLSADYVRVHNDGPGNVIITSDRMLLNANAANRALGQIASQLGLNPASPADRLTAYNRWRTFYDQFRNGTYYGSFGTSPSQDNFTHYGLSGTVAIDLGAASFKSITGYRRFKRYEIQDFDATPFDIINALNTTRQRNFTQEFQLSSFGQGKLDWQVGVFFNRESGNELQSNNQNIAVTAGRATVADGDVVNKSYAAYLQTTYHLTDTVRVTGGLRYTEDKRFFESHNRIDPGLAFAAPLAAAPGVCNLLSPALGGPVFPNCSYAVNKSFNAVSYLVSADWQVSPQALLYASTARGYRTGGFSLQGSARVQPSIAALNAAFTPFRPETVYNYEVGLKTDLLDRRLRVNVAAYYQDYRDIQAQIRDVVNGVVLTLIRNAAKAKIYGGELEVTAQPVRNLTITGTAAYLHARYDQFFAVDAAGATLDLSSQPFPQAPEWSWSLSGAYTIPTAFGSVRLATDYSWIDDVVFKPGTPDQASVTQTGFGLLNGRISAQLKGPDLEIAVFGKNLTKKHYLNAAQNLEALGFNLGYTGDPRVFGVQVRKRF